MKTEIKFFSDEHILGIEWKNDTGETQSDMIAFCKDRQYAEGISKMLNMSTGFRKEELIKDIE